MLLDELEAEPRVPVARLAAILRREAWRSSFGHDLAEAIGSGSATLERSGAWLLRRWLDAGGMLLEVDRGAIVDSLGAVRDWVARLELCRVLCDQPDLAAGADGDWAAFARGCAGDGKPFVRAWGIAAWQALASRHPRHRAEARRWLRQGRRDPAKSVQARLRRLAEEKPR
jgi:hypothetical protein